MKSNQIMWATIVKHNTLSSSQQQKFISDSPEGKSKNKAYLISGKGSVSVPTP